MGFIDKDKLEDQADALTKSGYGIYLHNVLNREK
jgi:hypothetical protein